MSLEIEKKFLLFENEISYITEDFINIFHSLKNVKKIINDMGYLIKQGYLEKHIINHLIKLFQINLDFRFDEGRLRQKDDYFFFTLKGSGGMVRNEFEIPVSKQIFNKFWEYTQGRRINKKRVDYEYRDIIITIDAYTDRKLMTAEIEFPDIKSSENCPAPGKDITELDEYKNKNLAK